MRIGLVSDTHDLLRPAVLAFLRGSDHIVHAGDICGPRVLDALRELAPVTAVRGNNDVGPWAEDLREVELVDWPGLRLLAVHDVADLRGRPMPDGVQVVVAGHSHQPLVREDAGRLFVNPGSAGPRRFRLPISAGELFVDGSGGVRAALHEFPA